MKRFTRKNQHNVSLDNIQKPFDQDTLSMSMSHSTNKNLTNSSVSIVSGIPKEYTKASISFLCTSVKSVLTKQKYYAFGRLSGLVESRDRGSVNILEVGLTYNRNQGIIKKISLDQLSTNKHTQKHKTKAAHLIKLAIIQIQQKLCLQSLLRIMQVQNISIQNENTQLKQTQQLYNQTHIPHQLMKQTRKFSNISPRNPKPFLKSTEQTLQPCLQTLSNYLQAKRIQPTVPSDPEVLVIILQNFVQAYRQLNLKFLNYQQETRVIEEEKQIYVLDLDNLKYQQDRKVKELNRYDNQIIKKWDVFTDWTVLKLRTLLKAVNQQMKMCQLKTSDGYQFVSRMVLLKTGSAVISKLIQTLQSHPSPPMSPPQPIQFPFSLPIPIPTSPTLSPISSLSSARKHKQKPRPSMIQQQNSLEQSDLVEEVIQLINEIVQNVRKEDTWVCGSLDKFLAQVFKGRKMWVEIGAIMGKLEELLEVFYGLYVAVYNQVTSKNQSISTLQQQLQLQTYQLQTLEEQLRITTEKLQNKQRQLQKMNQKYVQQRKKNKRFCQQYKRFTKKVNTSNDKKDLQKSITKIMNRRLNESVIQSRVQNIRNEHKRIQSSTLMLDSSNSFVLDCVGSKDCSRKVSRRVSKSKEKVENSLINQSLLSYQDESNQRNKKQQQVYIQSSSINRNKQFQNIQIRALKIQIEQLTKKLQISQKKLIQYSTFLPAPSQIPKPLESQTYLRLLPQNIITLLYNIIVRLQLLPQSSQLTLPIWNQLQEISEQSNGVQMLVGLEQFTVQWLMRNVVQVSGKKKKGEDDKRFKTPKKTKQLFLNEQLNKTIKVAQFKYQNF